MTGKSQNAGTTRNSFGRRCPLTPARRLRERIFLARAAPLHEGRLAGTKAPPRNRRGGAAFEDENRAFPPGAQIGGLVPGAHVRRLRSRSSPILYESSVFRLRPPASKSRLAERGLQSPTRGRTLRASRSRNRGSLALRSFPDPKCWSNRRYSVLVVWFEMPPSFRKEHRGISALLVFLVRRQGRYFGVKQGMPFLTFRRPRRPSQQEPFGMGPAGRLNGLICLSGVTGGCGLVPG
jgi:hypothetical protein